MTKEKNEGRSRREQFVNPAPAKPAIPRGPLVMLAVVVLASVVYRAGFYEPPPPAASAVVVTPAVAETPPRALRDGRQAPAAVRSDVVIPAAQFDGGMARFFTYDAEGGETVRFFVMKSSDGVIRAAFDACDVCYRERRGYRQQGEHMLCVNCGQSFPSTDINVRQGGCNPAPLDRALVDGQVVLKAADLERGAIYF